MRRTLPVTLALVAMAQLLLVEPLAFAQRRKPAPIPAAPMPRTPSVPIVLAPLAPLGASPSEAARATQILTAELRSFPEAQLVDPTRVRSLTSRHDYARCDDTACLVRLGRALGVSRVVGGDIGSLAGSHVVNLRLVDVSAGREARAVTAPLALSESEGPRTARAALVRLLAPARYTGALQVDVDVPGATIYLDGRPIGISPAGRITGIPVGTHALRVSKEEYRDHLAFVQIDYGQTQLVTAPLKAFPVVNEEVLARRQAKSDAPWYRRWYVLTGAALLIGAAIAVGIAVGTRIPADHTAQIR